MDRKKGGPLRELLETLGVALLLALFIRAFIFQVFYIPSSSMEPTLLIGDRLIVNKLANGIQNPFYDFHQEPYIFQLGFIEPPNPFYGKHLGFFDVKYFIHWGKGPQYQEITVFKFPDLTPNQPPKDYIKRVIGRPENTLSFDAGAIFVNGKKMEMKNQIVSDTFTHPMIAIPKGMYFMMGDNRPNSFDSRFWGPLPEDKIVGPAVLRIWPLTRIGKF